MKSSVLYYQHHGGGSYYLKGVAYGNGRVVVVGSAGHAWYSDARGASWTATLTGTSEDLYAVAWGDYQGGRFVAVGTHLTPGIL